MTCARSRRPSWLPDNFSFALACSLAFASLGPGAQLDAKDENQTKPSTQLSDQESAQKRGESWQPFDLAILFPFDSDAPLAESGLCNAPSLDMLTVAGKPLLPRRYFNRIVDEAFGLESYVAKPGYATASGTVTAVQLPPVSGDSVRVVTPLPQHQPLPPLLQIKRQQFSQQVKANLGRPTRADQLDAIRAAFEADAPAVADAAPLFCGRSVNESGIAKASDAVILDSGAHLAQLRRYPAALCKYENWRVTAVSFDLCLEQPEITDTATGMLPPECLTQEFRVTIKPVFSSAQRLTMVNAAIKLVFYLSPGGDDTLVAALKKLRTLTRIAAPGDKVNDGTLKPHPGLVDEMVRCDGAVAGSVRRVIGYHGLVKNLVSAQFSAANRDLNRLSMGVVPFYQARQESTMALDVVSSFSLRHLHPKVDLKPYSANIQPSVNQVVQGFAKPFRNAKLKITDATALSIGRDLVAKGNKIANPRLVSQFPLNPVTHGTDCLSCHVNEAAQAQVKASVAEVQQVASHAFRYYSKVGRLLKPWAELKPKTVGQIDNFGYYFDPRDGSIVYKIAERTINEADNQCRIVESYY